MKFETPRVMEPHEWLQAATASDLFHGFGDSFGSRYHGWIREVRIIENYMPPFPNDRTRPTLVIKFRESFLRYSNGPAQGFFWDVYGDDFQSVGLAMRAILNAPTPVIWDFSQTRFNPPNPDGYIPFEKRFPK